VPAGVFAGLAGASRLVRGSLIAFRELQGLGGHFARGAALMTTFAEGRERNLALGIYGTAGQRGGRDLVGGCSRPQLV
jgi:hypothetical protein